MYPPERLEFMLRDASAQTLIGTRSGASALAERAGPRLLDLDELLAGDGRAAADDDAPAASEPAPDRTALVAAYVLYTSGSTGRPKGALCTHRGLAAIMVHDYRTRGPLRPGEAHAVWTSVSFDVWLYEVLAALVVGARGARSGRYPLRRARGRAAGVRAAPHAGRLGAGRRRPGAARAGRRARDGSAQRLRHDGIAPLGRAIDGSWLAVLDDAGEPLPPGTTGELCIGGLGIALGYCNNPELSAARFHAAAEPELRYYRTGDLATLPADGLARFHGRKDRQFK